MLKHKKLRNLNDYFVELNNRQDKGVYFYRINQYSDEVDEFIKKYGEFSDDSYDDDDYAFILVNMNYKMLSDKNYKNYKFSPFDIQAQYNAISLIPDLDLYYDVMPDDYKKIEKAGDSNTILLPYVFAKSTLTEEHWKNFKNLDFKLSLNDAENKKIEINLKK